MKFIHVIHRPIPRLTIIFLSHFIRFCLRFGDLQKNTHEENREWNMQEEIFSIIFNYCELFGSLILIIIVHAKRDTEISMQNVVVVLGLFFQAKKIIS